MQFFFSPASSNFLDDGLPKCETGPNVARSKKKNQTNWLSKNWLPKIDFQKLAFSKKGLSYNRAADVVKGISPPNFTFFSDFTNEL